MNRYLILLGFMLTLIACESVPTIPSKQVFIVHNDTLGVFPNEFSLKEPYPNPFNYTLTINIEIPEQSFVSVVIQNPVGDLVKVLMSQEINRGSYELIWDATNEDNKTVNDGFYFVTMRYVNFSKSKIVKLFNP